MTAPESGIDARLEWRNVVGEDLPFDAEAVFPEVKGFLVKKANTRRAKLLAALKPTLLLALEKGEQVRYAARGHQYAAAEYYFSGMWVAMYSNQLALVLTDRRFLLIQVDSKGRARDIKNQIRLSEVRRVKNRGLFGSYWQIETLDKKKLAIMSLPKRDRRALEALCPAQPNATATAGPSLEHLCPSCLRVVPGKVGTAEVCPNEACRIPFRSPKKAARLSALIPGVGDLYLRHHLFGAMEFVGSMVMLAVAISMGLVAILSNTAESAMIAASMGLFLVVGPRIVDYFLTLHMGRKGLVPLSLAAAPLRPEEGGALELRAHKPLPSFPAWAYGLFLMGAVGLAGTVVLAVPEARMQAALAQARKAAEAGNFDEAWRRWDESQTHATAGANDKARLAYALYKGGDLEGGDKLLAGLGPVDEDVAKNINQFVAQLQAASDEHVQGQQALLEGKEEEAWPHIDRALEFYRTMPRTTLPRSRGEALLELAGNLLTPPPAEENVEAAMRLVGMAEKLPGLDSRLDVAQARVLSYTEKDASTAREKLAKVELASLQPAWALLALETRADLTGDEAELARVGEQASRLTGLSGPLLVRRVALMTQGGHESDADEQTNAAAADLLQESGRPQAAQRLLAGDTPP